MNLLVKLSDLFETYRVHDQALSLVGYNCSMLSGLCTSKNNQQLAKNLKGVSTQIVNARIILRLFDDASMLRYTISYGLGKFEKKYQIRLPLALVTLHVASLTIYFNCLVRIFSF